MNAVSRLIGSGLTVVDRCSLCPVAHTPLPPDGPGTVGGVLFVGEAPGINEEKRKRVFVGRTGDEVNSHYLPLAGLRRDMVTFANTIACLPNTSDHKLNPANKRHLELMNVCARHHLYPLIDQMKPKLIVPLGSFACRALTPGLDLEVEHGFPRDSFIGPEAFPMYHPALGMYEPKKMLQIRTDWHRLGLHLKKRLVLPEDEYPHPDYKEITHADELDEIEDDLPLGADTESGRDGPFCLTYSPKPGVGRLIRAERRDLLRLFEKKTRGRTARNPILFHMWPYDSPVTREMGMAIDSRSVVDTMVEVYHLGNLPQGLKALGRRILGMAMQDFLDLVPPFSNQLVLRYYELAAQIPWAKPPQELRADKFGELKLYSPQSMNTKFKRFFTDYGKDPEKDPIEMWDNWEDAHDMIEGALGPWPGLDIRHVPFEQALVYACRDADATLRLWAWILYMRRNVRRLSQELWGI